MDEGRSGRESFGQEVAKARAFQRQARGGAGNAPLTARHRHDQRLMQQLFDEVLSLAGSRWQAHTQVELEHLAAHPEELEGFLRELARNAKLRLAAWIFARARARTDPDSFDARPWDPVWLEQPTSTRAGTRRTRSGKLALPDRGGAGQRQCERPSRLAREELEAIVPEILETALALRVHGPRRDAEWFLRTLTRRSAPPELYCLAVRLVPWVRHVARLSDAAFTPSRRKMGASRTRARFREAAPEYGRLLDIWFPKRSHSWTDLVTLDDPVTARIRRLIEIAIAIGPPSRREDGRAPKRDMAALLFRLRSYWGAEGVERLEAANPRLGRFPVVDTVDQIARYTESSVRVVRAHVRVVEDVLSRVYPDWLTLMGMPAGAKPPSSVLQTG